MDLSPPTFMASFTDAHETRVCASGRNTRGEPYRDCSRDANLKLEA